MIEEIENHTSIHSVLRFYGTLIEEDWKEDYYQTLEKIKENPRHTSLESKKIHDDPQILFCVRVSIKCRMYYCIIKDSKGRNHLNVLDILPDHDYQKSPFTKQTYFRKYVERHSSDWKKLIETEEKNASGTSVKWEKLAFYNRNKMLSLRIDQEEALLQPTPCMLTGFGGTGKTSLIVPLIHTHLQALSQGQSLRVLCTTTNPKVINNIREACQQFNGITALILHVKPPEELISVPKNWTQVNGWENPAFTSWCKTHGYKDNKKRYYEYLRMSGYTLDTYCKAGKKHDNFAGINPQDRKELFSDFMAYLTFLYNAQYIDTHFAKIEEQYDLVIVDESHNFSWGMLNRLALCTLKNPKENTIENSNIYFSIDPHQCPYTYSPHDYLQSFCRSTVQLKVAYRGPYNLTHYLQEFINHKYKYTGGLSTRDEQQIIEVNAYSDTPGILQLYPCEKDFNEKTIQCEEKEGNKRCISPMEMVNGLSGTTQFIIITWEHCIPLAKKIFGENAPITTFEKSQGLEYETTMLFDPWNRQAFKGFNQNPVHKQKVHQPKNGLDPISQKITALLGIGLGRSLKHLILYQHSEKPTQGHPAFLLFQDMLKSYCKVLSDPLNQSSEFIFTPPKEATKEELQQAIQNNPEIADIYEVKLQKMVDKEEKQEKEEKEEKQESIPVMPLLPLQPPSKPQKNSLGIDNTSAPSVKKTLEYMIKDPQRFINRCKDVSYLREISELDFLKPHFELARQSLFQVLARDKKTGHIILDFLTQHTDCLWIKHLTEYQLCPPDPLDTPLYHLSQTQKGCDFLLLCSKKGNFFSQKINRNALYESGKNIPTALHFLLKNNAFDFLEYCLCTNATLLKLPTHNILFNSVNPNTVIPFKYLATSTKLKQQAHMLLYLYCIFNLKQLLNKLTPKEIMSLTNALYKSEKGQQLILLLSYYRKPNILKNGEFDIFFTGILQNEKYKQILDNLKKNSPYYWMYHFFKINIYTESLRIELNLEKIQDFLQMSNWRELLFVPLSNCLMLQQLQRTSSPHLEYAQDNLFSLLVAQNELIPLLDKNSNVKEVIQEIAVNSTPESLWTPCTPYRKSLPEILTQCTNQTLLFNMLCEINPTLMYTLKKKDLIDALRPFYQSLLSTWCLEKAKHALMLHMFTHNIPLCLELTGEDLMQPMKENNTNIYYKSLFNYLVLASSDTRKILCFILKRNKTLTKTIKNMQLWDTIIVNNQKYDSFFEYILNQEEGATLIGYLALHDPDKFSDISPEKFYRVAINGLSIFSHLSLMCHKIIMVILRQSPLLVHAITPEILFSINRYLNIRYSCINQLIDQGNEGHEILYNLMHNNNALLGGFYLQPQSTILSQIGPLNQTEWGQKIMGILNQFKRNHCSPNISFFQSLKNPVSQESGLPPPDPK